MAETTGGERLTTLAPVRSAWRSEVDAEGDRDVLQVRAFGVAAEHHVIARFDEGADDAEREAKAAADVEASGRLAVIGEVVLGELAVVDAHTADEIGRRTRRAECQRAVHRAGDDVGLAGARQGALGVEAVVGTFEPDAERNERRSEAETGGEIVAGVRHVLEVAE